MAGLIGLAQARWATFEEAPFQINDRTQIDKVNADGTWEREITEEIEVLNEVGRDRVATQRLFYNEASETVTILEAYTLKDGQKYIVDKDDIQDKPLASQPQGFDQGRQILLAYPHVAVGAKIYLKYKTICKRVPLPNMWNSVLWWGLDYYKKGRNVIQSAIPLKMKINDPTQALDIKETRQDGLHIIEITQKKPIYTDLVNDGQWRWIHPKKLTWVSLSSIEKWEDIAQQFAVGWEKKLSQPLPLRFEEVAKKAQEKKTEVEQINTVTSLLSEMIQYMGDWRTIEGGCWPRDLAKIDATHIGDCKDFSVMTVAILRKLGFKADPVLVQRGEEERDLEGALPFLAAFNHAMVKAIGKSGKVYWVDPTNMVSMAQGLFPDIAGKRALVLNTKTPSYEKIPEVSRLTKKLTSERTISVNKDCSVDVDGKATFQGEAALNWAGKGLYLSSKAMEEEVILQAAGEHLDKQDRLSVQMPDLTSRIVKDLKFQYTYHQKNEAKKTNKGYYIEILSPFSLQSGEEQVSDMYLGPPMTIKKVRVLKTGKIGDTKYLNHEVKTPWVDIKRTCKQEEGHLRIEDVLAIKTRFIPVEVLQGPVYKKLKESVKRYFDAGIVVELN